MPSMQKWITLFLGLLLLAGTAAVAGADDVALGRQIYFQRCVSCHGLTGEGDGPVAPALSTPPANLRLLSDRFGNPLPEDQVARFIDGRVEVKAHERHASMGRALLRRDARRERGPDANRQAGRLCAVDPNRRPPRAKITRRERLITPASGQSGPLALGRNHQPIVLHLHIDRATFGPSMST